MTASTRLVVRDLHVCFGARAVLQGLDLDLWPGQIRVLRGSNGAGKSTLLNAIASLVRVRQGQVSWQGRSLVGLQADAVARAGIVLVPQGHLVFPRLSVGRNLELGGYGRPRDAAWRADMARVQHWFPVLAARQQQAAGSLSGGEQQMLALARALMRRPRVLLLDEPTLGLAPQAARQLLGIVRGIREDTGAAVLLVEQNLALAAELLSGTLPPVHGPGNRPKVQCGTADAGIPSGAGAHDTGLHNTSDPCPAPDGWLVLERGRAHAA